MSLLHIDVLQTNLNDIISLAHISGIASNAVPVSGVVTSLTHNKSNRIYLSDNVSTFLIADVVLGISFCGRYVFET